MDAYATHQQALVEAVLATKGPILELGCGDYSTPLLAALARDQGRKFLVQARDEKWASKYTNIAKVEIVPAWETWEPPAGRWGLAMIDNEEKTEGRMLRLPQLARCCDVVVMHDAERVVEKPEWRKLVRGYKHVTIHMLHIPWTAVFASCTKDEK